MPRWSLLLAMLFALAGWVAGPGTVDAAHVAAHQCGVKSASFARTCRPSAHTSCLGAVERGVAGFTKDLCEKRKAACSKCLADVHTCIARIGHWPKLSHTCDKCTARFNSCYAKRYPKT